MSERNTTSEELQEPVLRVEAKPQKPEELPNRLFDSIKLIAGACGAVASMLVGSIFGDTGTLIGASTGSLIAGIIAALFERNTRKASGYLSPYARRWRSHFKLHLQWKRPDLPNGIVVAAVCLFGLMGGIALAESWTGLTVHGIVTHTTDRGSSFGGSKVVPATTPAYQPQPTYSPSYHPSYPVPVTTPAFTPATLVPTVTPTAVPVPTVSTAPFVSPSATASSSVTPSNSSSSMISAQPTDSASVTQQSSVPTSSPAGTVAPVTAPASSPTLVPAVQPAISSSLAPSSFQPS
jgi:hypothetical protein